MMSRASSVCTLRMQAETDPKRVTSQNGTRRDETRKGERARERERERERERDGEGEWRGEGEGSE